MNKLIIFNEPVKSVGKSQQMIYSQIGLIRLQLFSSRQLTDSNDPFRASLQRTELTSKNREILWARATDAAKSMLLISNFRINYCNLKSYLCQICQLFVN